MCGVGSNRNSKPFMNGRGQHLHTVEFVPSGTWQGNPHLPPWLRGAHWTIQPWCGMLQSHECLPSAKSRLTGPSVPSSSTYDTAAIWSESPSNVARVRCGAVFGLAAAAGIALHALDCHGHGRSEPLEERDRALIWDFQHVVRPSQFLPCAVKTLKPQRPGSDPPHQVLQHAGMAASEAWCLSLPNAKVDDLLAFSKEVRLQYSSSIPAFIGGQSMGALAALHAVLRDQRPWAGIILGTATIDVEMSTLLRCRTHTPPLCAAGGHSTHMQV